MISNSGIWVTPHTGLIPSPKDIAVHAGRITRYAGALWCPLLSHLVFVGELVWACQQMCLGRAFNYETWAWALLHDAHETFMGEIPRRWKIGERRAQEKEVDVLILKAFHLDPAKINFNLVKQADERALLAEAVSMKLPGFPEKYCAENGLAEFPAPHEGELEMAFALQRSDFHRAPGCLDPESLAVKGFGSVLERIQTRNLAQALSEFRELLNAVLPPYDAEVAP